MHHSRDEVRDYIREKGLAVDPDDFWEYYSVRGWQLSGEPIRDWKILAHRWDRREYARKEADVSYEGVDLSEFGIQG